MDEIKPWSRLRETVKHVARHREELLAALAETEKLLHYNMREMRKAGATQVEIMTASGYRSLDAVRKILDVRAKELAAQARRDQRERARRAAAVASPWKIEMPELGMTPRREGGCGKIRFDHASPPHGPRCLLDDGHDEECQYPDYPINHPHDERGQCVTDGSSVA